MLKIHQIRNATIVIEWNDSFILVDPMLSPKGALPALKYVTLNRQRNPTVELPEEFQHLKLKINAALITHCQKSHFDHLDSVGYKFLRESQVPTFCATRDYDFLSKRGVNVVEVKDETSNDFLGASIQTVPALHGRGIMKFLMEHGRGFMMSFPDGPKVYVMGDTVLTPEIENIIQENKPDIIVAPAGYARFDFGSEILMSPSELKRLTQISNAKILANHMDAVDHCRQTRKDLARYIESNKLSGKIIILGDGEAFDCSPGPKSKLYFMSSR
jgi:L-ascorbate metabolism protein UlaG (beta-lactamase superfamily)